MGRIFAPPLLIGLTSTAGLLGDGIYDGLSWLGLGILWPP